MGPGDRLAEWIRDRVWRELAGRHLIEKGGEQVIVVPVQQGEVDLARAEEAVEPPDQMEAGESATDDDDPLRHQLTVPTAASTRTSSSR